MVPYIMQYKKKDKIENGKKLRKMVLVLRADDKIIRHESVEVFLSWVHHTNVMMTVLESNYFEQIFGQRKIDQ